MVSTDLQAHMVSLSEIVPYAGNAKEHPIGDVCRGDRKSAGGTHWRYA